MNGRVLTFIVPLLASGAVVALKIWNSFGWFGMSPATLKSSRLNGLGTTLSQTAICPSTFLPGWAAPPASRFGNVG